VIKPRHYAIIGFGSLALLVGCASKLASHDDRARDAAAGDDAGTREASGAFTHRVAEDGVVRTVVDATDEQAWRYLDLDSRRDDGAAARWDLGFSRFRVRTNGGASGDGGVQVAALAGQDFDALKRAPDAGFRADQPDGAEDTDTEPDNAFNSGPEDWYDYNVMTHALTPRAITYVIASTEGRFYKLRIEDYYDSAGTPGFLSFRWAEIDAPANGLPASDDEDDDGGTQEKP
jgi:hypothetical protein